MSMVQIPEWAEVIGPVAYEHLVEAINLDDYLVPTSIESKRGQQLASLIGDYPARRLIDYAGGTEVYIRKTSTAERHRHLEVLKAMRKGGMTPQQISDRYTYPARLSVRRIRQILAEHGEA